MDSLRITESFYQGCCVDAYHLFGAHPSFEGEQGVRFTVYAPHARNVYVIGNFTDWAQRPIAMERTDFLGIWSVFVKGVREWDSYKYQIEDRNGNYFDKADPFAFYAETRPDTASKVYNFENIHWHDAKWMGERTRNFDKPLNIYEVYAGGWRRNGEYPYTYLMMKDHLIPYVKEHGYTHIEMMPLNEHPFDGSWGYQASGYFALTSRYGNPTEFAQFVDACHQEGIGVIMDMVPVHFVKDAFGLANFDGEPLYEYPKKEDAESQWGTLNFDLWKEEVRSFLISAASFWCDIYHMDGIRMDAVSNLIYWGGNSDRGENQGSLDFIKRLNYYIHQNYPTVMMFAEDSSSYPKVTGNVEDGTLGFDYKWDLGWMNDTLKYYATDPIFKYYDHHKLTFSMHYYYSERFILPLSHDENVHGKKTVLDQMWGDYNTKFALARNLYAYMFAHPGKKLNFMGNEIGSFREFDEKKELDWMLLDYPIHQQFAQFCKDLNHLYLTHPCLSENDYKNGGFKWIDADNAKQSVYSFMRMNNDEILVCIMNHANTEYPKFAVEVPQEGCYKVLLNSQSSKYGGWGICNEEPLYTTKTDAQTLLHVDLAPFAVVWLSIKRKREKENV